SAGWSQARLILSDDAAQIEYDSASMGEVPVRYVIQCKHVKISDFHGLLIAYVIEQHETYKDQSGIARLSNTKGICRIGDLIDPNTDETMLEVYNQLQIEYIRFSQPHIRLEEPGGNYGVHERPETFSLILLIHFAGFWYDESRIFENTPLGRGLI